MRQIIKRNHSRLLLGLFSVSWFFVVPAQAADQYIVRVNSGLSVLQQVCTVLGCNVMETLDGSVGQLFLITPSGALSGTAFLNALLGQAGVADVEPDVTASVTGSNYTVPPALYDSKRVSYYGATVPEGYVSQPAAQIVAVHQTQNFLGVKGAGTVAVIDTGIDPQHPALRSVLVPGYDFTRNEDGEGDETLDVALASQPSPNPSQSFWTGGQSNALVDQSTAAVIDGNPQYGDFGHGTMVAGVIHLVAPGAKLMPLKAFHSDGTGNTSDILRATYWAIQHGANIINMSFNLPGYSLEMKMALDVATMKGLICVAAAGNQGTNTATYPAAYRNVISVASSTNNNQRSSFSNYGDWVWVAAPGEGIVTTYPFATYAAGWGTSFSTPFVSGTASLMLDYAGSLLSAILVSNDQAVCANAVAHANPMNPPLGNGVLSTYPAVGAWRGAMGNSW